MRNHSLAIVGLVTSLWQIALLPARSQTYQRYPEFAEAEAAIAQQWLPLMPEQLQLSAYQDMRTAQEIEQTNTFTQAWARVSPSTARFLGEWHGVSQGDELIVAIYPSNNSPGRVCVLQYTKSSDTYQFGVGSILFNQPQINVTGGREFVTSFQHVPDANRNHLVQVVINPNTNQPDVGGHVAFPRPLRDPRQVVPPALQAAINLRNYDITNCTTGLPEARTGALLNHPLSGEETRSGVTFRFTGAYVNENPNSRSVVAYWSIDNLSDRLFSFYPNQVMVVDQTGQPIDCRDALRPVEDNGTGCARLTVDQDNDPAVEPGERITGQITILRRLSDLEGLYLVLPEASLERRQFQVPIQIR